MFLIYCVLDLDLPIVYVACSMKGHLVTLLEFERSEDILSFLIGKSEDIYRTRVILHLEVAVCRMAHDGDDTGKLVDIGIVVRQCEEIGDGDLGILGVLGFALLIYLHEYGGSFRGAELDLGSTGICHRLIGFGRNTKGIGTERLCLRTHGKPFLGIVRDDDLIVKIGLHESLGISSGGGNRDSRSNIEDSLGKTENDTADRLVGVAYRHHQNITRDNVGLGGNIDLRGIVSHREIIALYEEFLRAVGSIDRIRDLGGDSRLDHIVKRCDIQGETTGLGKGNGRAGAGDGKIHEVGILGHDHSGQTLGRTDVLPVLAVIRYEPFAVLDLDLRYGTRDDYALTVSVKQPFAVDRPIENAVVGLDSDMGGGALLSIGNGYGGTVGERDIISVLGLGYRIDGDILLKRLDNRLERSDVGIDAVDLGFQIGDTAF